jgi:ribonuclease III
MARSFLIRDILLRIRLLTVKQKEPYLLFHSILGFYPRHIDLYELALRHKSTSIRSEDGILLNNERLEFLGDAVLSVLVSDILFHHFETKKEGFLTKTRASIVQRESLNKFAVALGLDKLIIATPTANTPHLSIYGNALEALIGAIYTDQGFGRCRQFLEKQIIARFIDLDGLAATNVNYKSTLLEQSQREKKPIRFETKEEYLDGRKIISFHAAVFQGNTLLGEGRGYSKKEAQQQASKQALEHKTTPHEANMEEATEEKA